MKIALAQFNPTVGDFDGNSAAHPGIGAAKPNRAAPIWPSSPNCACAAIRRRISSNALPSSNATTRRLEKSRQEIPHAIHRRLRGQSAGRHRQARRKLRRAHRATEKSSSSSARCCCPPTMSSTSRAISSRRHSQHVFPLRRRAARHHHLRRLLERQELLGAAPLRSRSRRRTGRAGKHDSSEYLGFPVHHRQALSCASTCCAPSPSEHQRAGGLRQSSRRQRQPDLRRLQRCHSLPDGRVAAQAHSFEEDLVFFDTVTGEGDIRPQPDDELEAAYQALVLGTRDYVRKCGFSKVVVGLSGGSRFRPGRRHRRRRGGSGERARASPCPGPIPRKAAFAMPAQLAENLEIQFDHPADHRTV